METNFRRKIVIKFGELWSSNSGVYGDGLVTIYVLNV